MIGALSRFEEAALRLAGETPPYPPIFVLGAPRSGTTALFLTFVNSYRVSYFPNLSDYVPRLPVSAAIAGWVLTHYRPTFRQRFGVVDQPLGPSDGWNIFHRWFDRDYEESIDLSEFRHLQRLVTTFEHLFRAPFCVRHNLSSIRVRHLLRLFPKAVFPAIFRDYREAAVSLAEAYRVHDVSADRWWSAGPPECDLLDFETPLEKAVYQVLGVEAIMRRDLQHVPDDRSLLVSYRSFCDDTGAVRSWAEDIFHRSDAPLRKRDGYAEVPEHISQSSRLTHRLEESKEELKTYYRHFLEGRHLTSREVLTDRLRHSVQPHISP
ncbi:MAG: sulfotransferase [Planctomycetota bacterium]